MICVELLYYCISYNKIDSTKYFTIYCNASGVGLGGVLMQKGKETDGLIAFIKALSFLVEQIRDHQFDDKKLCLIRGFVMIWEVKEVSLDSDDILRISGRIYVPKVGEL
ncbi:hypothetical protein MTR67_011726, partial [Solanum verrucosum]